MEEVGNELRRKRDERDNQEQQQVDEHEGAVGTLDRSHVVVMVDPDDPDRDEARHVGEVGGPDARELVAELRAARAPDADLEYQQCRGDREDAVAEGFDSDGPDLVHPGSRSSSADRPYLLRPCPWSDWWRPQPSQGPRGAATSAAPHQGS